MKKFTRLLIASVFAASLLLSAVPAFADSPTDEILNYEITVDVNEDATLNMHYHLEWKVLESDGIGPLSWITIGIPNRHCIDYSAASDNIKSIVYEGDGYSNLRIDFKKEYYEGEIISFDFDFRQDYMYTMNLYEQGKTVYQFTPGWFDEIAVKNITVRWNNADAESWSPSCKVEGGYLVWSDSLGPGSIMETVQITYPNEALGFDSAKSIQTGDFDVGDVYYDDDYSSSGGLFAVLGTIPFIFWIIIIWIIVSRVKKKYAEGANFGATTKTKVTRTKVVYHPSCPSCGAARAEGETNCSYCGTSFIKSEEIIKEEDLPEEDKNNLKYKTKGEYRYSDSPNTYMRVNVINIPAFSSRSSTRSSGSSSGSSRSSGGGCACACVSCACACACACAGGGRAGCSAKDFYNTNLKLKQLELKKRRSGKRADEA